MGGEGFCVVSLIVIFFFYSSSFQFTYMAFISSSRKHFASHASTLESSIPIHALHPHIECL